MSEVLVFKDAEDENGLRSSFPHRYDGISPTLTDDARSVLDDDHYRPKYHQKYSSTYLNRFFNGREVMKTAQGVIRLLEQEGVEYDAVAFRGVSGALIAPLVAALTSKEIIVSRKKGTEKSHCFRDSEGPNHKVTYVIVDDLVSSGATCNEIVKAASKLNRLNHCAAIVEYNYLSYVEESQDRPCRHIVNAEGTRQHHDSVPIYHHLKVQSYELANRDDDLEMPEGELRFSNGSVMQFKTPVGVTGLKDYQKAIYETVTGRFTGENPRLESENVA